jgi:hypothetical protein
MSFGMLTHVGNLTPLEKQDTKGQPGSISLLNLQQVKPIENDNKQKYIYHVPGTRGTAENIQK